MVSWRLQGFVVSAVLLSVVLVSVVNVMP